MVTKVNDPYPVISDLDGTPLENGYIYIGEPSLDPEAFPKAAFWDQGQTIAATQPVRTIAGRFVNLGSQIGNLYVEGGYSILAKDKNMVTVFSAETQTDPVIFFDTIAAMAAGSFGDGDYVEVRSGFNGEPETFRYDASSTLTADGALIVTATGMGVGRLVSTRKTLATVTGLLTGDLRAYEAYTAGETVEAAGFLFEVAASGATDQDLTTAGGVKLYFATVGYGQDRTQYRTGGGAVRQTAAAGGWSFINDAGHEPWGWADSTPVQVSGTKLRITNDFIADEVGTFSVTPDESYAAIGLTVGASVGQEITDITGFAPISGRISTGTSGVSFSSTSGNVISQVVDQAAGTITLSHLSQTHTDANGTAVMVSDYAGASIGNFAVASSTKTGFVLQYVRPLSCRVTCTTATSGGEVFTVSQTENIGISAEWNAGGFLRITHPAVGNNFPAANVQLHKNSAGKYQWKIDAGNTTTDIYFLNADGTTVSAASTNMIINFSLPGKFPAAIPGGSATIGQVQRDMAPVDFNQISGPSSNLWLSYAHPHTVPS